MFNHIIVDNRRVRRKRKLIIDEQKSITSEQMKIQMSDTSAIVMPLDLAPPTKKLMYWKETGGVDKLCGMTARRMYAAPLIKVQMYYVLQYPSFYYL